MAKSVISTYVQLASGIGELTKSKAKEAAAEIMALAEEGSPKKLGKQASKLADDLVKTARENQLQLAKVVAKEVDSAIRRLDVSVLTKDLQVVVDLVTSLAGQVEELGTMVREGMSPRTDRAPAATAAAAPTHEPRVRSVPARRRPPRRSIGASAVAAVPEAAAKAPETPAAAIVTPALVKKAPIKKAAVKKAAVKKPVAKKTPVAKKVAVKAPVAKKAAVKAPVAKKAAVKKPAVKKITPPTSAGTA